MTPPLPSQQLAPAERALAARIAAPPEVALVLGSGLGALGDRIEGATRIGYGELPGMPTSAVVGHAGRFLGGQLCGRQVIAMQGRVHLYEGYDAAQVVFGVRLMLRLGARTLIVSNAAGGIRADLAPGSLMLIEDQLNLTGHTPLRGPNDPALGVRFPDMSTAYDPALLACAQAAGARTGVAVARGVYAGLLGPSYETPAEIRMLRTLGADAVGMSTVLEVIAARHMGARVLGISCVTNPAAGLSSQPLSHAEVEQTAEASRERFARLIEGVLKELPA
jgi:purine-nucleoside phosphorylase